MLFARGLRPNFVQARPHLHVQCSQVENGGVCAGRIGPLCMLQISIKTNPKWPNVLKIAKLKSQHFAHLNFKWNKSKNAILIGKVLVHDVYIFGKRR